MRNAISPKRRFLRRACGAMLMLVVGMTVTVTAQDEAAFWRQWEREWRKGWGIVMSSFINGAEWRENATSPKREFTVQGDGGAVTIGAPFAYYGAAVVMPDGSERRPPEGSSAFIVDEDRVVLMRAGELWRNVEGVHPAFPDKPARFHFNTFWEGGTIIADANGELPAFSPPAMGFSIGGIIRSTQEGWSFTPDQAESAFTIYHFGKVYKVTAIPSTSTDNSLPLYFRIVRRPFNIRPGEVSVPFFWRGWWLMPEFLLRQFDEEAVSRGRFRNDRSARRAEH